MSDLSLIHISAINCAEGYKEPKAVADEGYAFDKWVVKDVENKDGIVTAEPGTYKVTGNTAVYAEFAEDKNGNGKPCLLYTSKKAIQQLPGQPSKKPCSRRKLY